MKMFSVFRQVLIPSTPRFTRFHRLYAGGTIRHRNDRAFSSAISARSFLKYAGFLVEDYSKIFTEIYRSLLSRRETQILQLVLEMCPSSIIDSLIMREC